MTGENSGAALKKIRGLLSLCARARRLTSGAQGVEAALRKGQGSLLIADADCSAETRRGLVSAADRAGIGLWFSPFPVGEAIGKENRKIILIQDNGFAGAIRQCLEELGDGEPPQDMTITNREDTGVENT